MNVLKHNLDYVTQKIKQHCAKSSRNTDEISLIAVTKTISLDKIHEIRQLGITQFGENKVQELVSKFDYFDENVNWHLIGHLQTNKVKYIMDKVKLIHSLDNIKLADEINKRANNLNIIKDVLIEINIANEHSKNGLQLEDVYGFVSSLKNHKNIFIKGLMTVAPYTDKPEQNRIYFKQMKKIFDDLKEFNGTNVNMEILSMGMTNDFTVAIEEGATMIRVGTGLFGERN